MADKLQKLLAHAGLGSRRELESWISAGRVTVNGKTAKLGDRARSEDQIRVDGKPMQLESAHHQPTRALIYHKPEGQICSRHDPQGRPTIFDSLPAIPGGRWVSIGRLDLNSSGLLLFTNNGDIANALMHPSSGLEREYLVRVRGLVSDTTSQTLTREGVEIEGKRARFKSVVAADAAEEGSNHWYRVVITEGRYREVRRLFAAVGHTVSRLKRIRYGSVKLSRDLKQGQFAQMAPKQLEKLVKTAGLTDRFAAFLFSGFQSSKSQNRGKQRFAKQRAKPRQRGQRRVNKPAR